MRSNSGCWIKIFNDGTKEQGLDSDIQAGKSSWSRGRQDNIKEVLLFDDFITANLCVPDTDWYQFDRYLAAIAVGSNKSVRTHRVIQAQIKEHHLDSYFIGNMNNNKNMVWAIVGDLSASYDFKKKITDKEIGKWVSVVLHHHGHPFVTLSNKGKIHG